MLRYIKGDFVVSGPDIVPTRFKSRGEAKNWCRTHYPGSPITEIGRDAAKRGDAKLTVTLSPNDPVAKAPRKTGFKK
jgi:hypothetical protein